MGKIDFNAIRESTSLVDVVGRRVELRKMAGSGGDYEGLCPFHNEKTPSFTVNEQKQFYHCFGCGAHGDVLDFVMRTEGIKEFKEAIARLNVQAPAPAVVQRRATERTLRQQARTQSILTFARRIWDSGVPVEPGSPPDLYLRHTRRIGLERWPNTIRYVERCPYDKAVTAPALVCARLTVAGLFTGIWRIFLHRDDQGRWDKWRGPDGQGNARKGLGSGPGSCIWVGQAVADRPLLLAEGFEEAVTARMARPEWPAWAATGTSNMTKVIVPPWVRRVIICQNRDNRRHRRDGTEFYPGQEAARVTGQRLLAERRDLEVLIANPHDGDFNAMMMWNNPPEQNLEAVRQVIDLAKPLRLGE